MIQRYLVACLSVLLAASCGEASKPEVRASVPPIDLQAIEARSDWMPTGLAWDAAQERLYLLDGARGIYVLDRNGALVGRVNIERPDGRMLNDLVLTGTSLVTLSDVAGYHVDLDKGSLSPFFCLLPDPPQDMPAGTGGAGGGGGSGASAGGGQGGSGGGESMSEPPPCEFHRAGALAFLPAEGRLVTAPQYFDCTSTSPAWTELEGYDVSSGERVLTMIVDEPVFLGGLVWDPSRKTMLGAQGGRIVEIDATGSFIENSLSKNDYGDVQALSLDTGGHGLWILDGQSLRILHADLQ